MNNLKLLSKRCHEAFSSLKNPVFMRVFRVFGIIPTPSRQTYTKHICLVFISLRKWAAPIIRIVSAIRIFVAKPLPKANGAFYQVDYKYYSIKSVTQQRRT